MNILKKALLAAAAVIILGVVLLPAGCGRSGNRDTERIETAMYTCPMHPAYTSDKHGDCPICGMKLVAKRTLLERASARTDNKSDLREEKTLDEVCIDHKCDMKNCPMMIRAHLKPGERMSCPVCGEVIATMNGKVVEIPKAGITAPAVNKQERKVLYYRNPMDPRSTSPVPMKDPMGMDYVPVYEEPLSGTFPGGSLVAISQDRQQMIGVRTETVRVIDLAKVIRASGKIAYDPELAVTQEEFVQALNTEDNLKDSPLKDVIDRARSITEASRNKLKLLGMSGDEISALEKVRKVGTSTYLPSKGQSVWAYISVYEYEIGAIKTGDNVDIEAVAYPGEKFMGKVVSINPVLDPVTRTDQVRVEVLNPDSKLKPEMFVSASIKISLGPKLAVPVAAVLDTGLRKIVYVSSGNDMLESREVTLGGKAGNYYEVISGLKEGDLVVTSGNFLVDSESKLKSLSEGK
ncbi:MAG: efflux RND transporter periplasmic adaptor subunit [Candidatus Omnitrophica bacterium]|nr:efflux RND transporter periplasmic adaptor subunit [Candidatus Omnitrophota bacterium]